MSGDPVDKRFSQRSQPTEGQPSSLRGPTSQAPVSTDEIDDAWTSAESPDSSERPKPASERRPLSERPSVTSRPPAVRVSLIAAPQANAGATRRSTLLGVAPTASADPARAPSTPPTPSLPTASPDDGLSKFEAAARLLEQKQAGQPPQPRIADADLGAAPEPAPELSGETAEAPKARVTQAASEGDETSRRPRADAAPNARRRSSAPPPPRHSGILRFTLGAMLFAVMFLAGAMRALRDDPSATKSNTSSSSVVESSAARKPAASPVSLPTAAPPVVAQPEPATEGAAAPATSIAPPVTSAEPVRTGETTRVMVRAAVSGAKFFRYGKQVGTNSVIVELAPGEKRVFEVNLPGYVSRKVVVDERRSEVVVSLRRIPQTPAPTHEDPTPPSNAEPSAAAPQESSATTP